MNLLVQGGANILHHLRGKVAAEQVCKEKARQIYTLIWISVAVILRDSPAGYPENLSRHVTEEARLRIHALLLDANVGKELNVEDILDPQRLL